MCVCVCAIQFSCQEHDLNLILVARQLLFILLSRLVHSLSVTEIRSVCIVVCLSVCSCIGQYFQTQFFLHFLIQSFPPYSPDTRQTLATHRHTLTKHSPHIATHSPSTRHTLTSKSPRYRLMCPCTPASSHASRMAARGVSSPASTPPPGTIHEHGSFLLDTSKTCEKQNKGVSTGVEMKELT